jgi:membrane protein implicated in regulation of membrane protease activity
MSWWMWVLLGVVLLAVEIVTPGGLFALFFGLSAVLVGGLAAAGVSAPWLQWLLFAALGVALLAALRRRLQTRVGRGPVVGGLVGEVAFPREDLAPGATGSADLRGTPWTATNEGGVPLARGQRCRVSRVQDLTIFIRPE